MPHRNYYAGMPLDRGDTIRKDPTRVAALLADPATRVLPVWRYRHLVTDVQAPRPVWITVADLPASLLAGAVLLGLADGRAHFCIDISEIEDPTAFSPFAGAGEFVDLRAVGPLLARDDGAAMAYARGLVYWHRRHRYCGICGGATESTHGGHIRRCTACGEQHFPRTDPAVIMLVTRGDYCLLGRAPRFPPGMHSTLAGFVEPGESLEEAVSREVREETGLVVGAVTYQSSQPWPFPASIMLGFRAVAVTERLTVNRDELESARWYHRRELDHPPDDSFRLPRLDSIARRLIDDWRQETA